jgi:hypothetical protein
MFTGYTYNNIQINNLDVLLTKIGCLEIHFIISQNMYKNGYILPQAGNMGNIPRSMVLFHNDSPLGQRNSLTMYIESF